MPINESLIISQFFTSMHRCGIKPRENFNPDMDGKTHRFAVDGDRGNSKSGAYFVHVDGCPNWGVMDYHSHTEMQKFSFDFDAISDDEKREYARQQNNPKQRKISEAQRKEDERRKEAERNAKEKMVQDITAIALAEYEAADSDIERHPYLIERFVDKGISIPDFGVFSTRYREHSKDEIDYSTITRYPVRICHVPICGGKCRKGTLIVPFVNIETGKIQTLQMIPPIHNKRGKFDKKFDKWFYAGLPQAGTAHVLMPDGGENSTIAFCCEGLITGLAVLLITGGQQPVYCVGGCGNYIHVCTALRKRYPKRKICIMADNDIHRKGIKAAEDCISAGIADDYKYPPKPDTDFYDYILEKLRS